MVLLAGSIGNDIFCGIRGGSLVSVGDIETIIFVIERYPAVRTAGPSRRISLQVKAWENGANRCTWDRDSYSSYNEFISDLQAFGGKQDIQAWTAMSSMGVDHYFKTREEIPEGMTLIQEITIHQVRPEELDSRLAALHQISEKRIDSLWR